MSSNPHLTDRHSRRLSQSYSSTLPNIRTSSSRPSSLGDKRQSIFYAGVRVSDKENNMAGVGTWSTKASMRTHAVDDLATIPCRRVQSEAEIDMDDEPNAEEPISRSGPLTVPIYKHASYSTNSLLSPPNTPISPKSASPNKLRKSPPAQRPQPRQVIYFYNREDPHYGFTNFSPHEVWFEKKKYPTSEHLFQSLKFQGHRPFLAEHIRLFSEKPSVALSEARRFSPEVRSDWMNVNIAMMELTLWHKFDQHPDLKQELLDTGDAELIEDSDKDSFWGVGADRNGRNELGKALMKLRTKLRSGLE